MAIPRPKMLLYDDILYQERFHPPLVKDEDYPNRFNTQENNINLIKPVKFQPTISNDYLQKTRDINLIKPVEYKFPESQPSSNNTSGYDDDLVLDSGYVPLFAPVFQWWRDRKKK